MPYEGGLRIIGEGGCGEDGDGGEDEVYDINCHFRNLWNLAFQIGPIVREIGLCGSELEYTFFFLYLSSQDSHFQVHDVLFCLESYKPILKNHYTYYLQKHTLEEGHN